MLRRESLPVKVSSGSVRSVRRSVTAADRSTATAAVRRRSNGTPEATFDPGQRSLGRSFGRRESCAAAMETMVPFAGGRGSVTVAACAREWFAQR